MSAPDELLGSILTLAEAAARLKLTPNALARAARAAGRGSQFGRDWRFTETDLAGILEARRVPRTATFGYKVASAPSGDAFERLCARAAKRKAARR